MQIRYVQFATEGFLWIPDLCVPETTLILPLTVGLAHLVNLEVSMSRVANPTPPTRMRRYMTNFLRLVAVAMVPISFLVPSAISLYWATSGVCGVLVTLTLMSPRVRALVKIPKMPGTPDAPYRALVENMTNRALSFTDRTLSRLRLR